MNDTVVDPKIYFGNKSESYGTQYQESAAVAYHANQYRLKIFMNYLRDIKPNRILDVGCGSGEPLLEMLQNGYDVHAIDGAPEMVAQSQQLLREHGFSEDIVSESKMEDLSQFPRESFDCITAMGSLYYSNQFDLTMSQVTDKLEKGGDLIASFRNELFSLFSHNEYTADFLFNTLLDTGSVDEDLLAHAKSEFSEKLFKNKFKVSSVDSDKVYSQFHNPLTIQSELSKYDLQLESVKYYHFHPLPPYFKLHFPDAFAKSMHKIESPDDWRGLFMASCFVIKAKKAQ